MSSPKTGEPARLAQNWPIIAEMPKQRALQTTHSPHLPESRPGQAGGKRDQNRRERTRGLLAASLGLFLERGLDGTTIDDITREAKVAKGSFYRYFQSKEDLISALFAPAGARVAAAFTRAEARLGKVGRPGEVERAYLRLGRELLLAVMAEPDVTRLYLQESRSPGDSARRPIQELERLIAKAALRVSELALSHGLLRETHPEVSTLAVIGAAERLLQAYFSGQLSVEPGEAIRDLVAIVMNGLRRPDRQTQR